MLAISIISPGWFSRATSMMVLKTDFTSVETYWLQVWPGLRQSAPRSVGEGTETFTDPSLPNAPANLNDTTTRTSQQPCGDGVYCQAGLEIPCPLGSFCMSGVQQLCQALERVR